MHEEMEMKSFSRVVSTCFDWRTVPSTVDRFVDSSIICRHEFTALVTSHLRWTGIANQEREMK